MEQSHDNAEMVFALGNSSGESEGNGTTECNDVGQTVLEGDRQLIAGSSADAAAAVALPSTQEPDAQEHDGFRDRVVDSSELLRQMLNQAIAHKAKLASMQPSSTDDTDSHVFRPISPQPVSSHPIEVVVPQAVPASGVRVYRAIAPKQTGAAQQGQPCAVRVTFRQPEPVRPAPASETASLDMLAHAAASRRKSAAILELPATGTTGFPTDQRIRQWLSEVDVPLSAKHEAYCYARYLMKAFVQQLFSEAHAEAVKNAGNERVFIDIAHMKEVLRPHKRGGTQPR